MRGKPPVKTFGGYTTRLIPAHAGKTSRNTSRASNARAHPRACGENQRASSSGTARGGSSPRMRGKRYVNISVCKPARLIPAHAGKTRIGEAIHSSGRAHPRACGENPRPMWIGIRVLGSSPRMRGKREPGGRSPVDTGLIPAHAGKTKTLT